MATSTYNLMVGTDHSVPVEPLGGTATVKVNSGDTVYCNDNPAVNATHNIGSIVAGSSANLTVASWLKSAGTSSVTISTAESAGANAVTGSQAAPGNLGATYTVDFASVANALVEVKGVLNANCTITLSNRAAGCRALLLLSQDATGGRTLTISDGAASSQVTIPQAPLATATLAVDCPDASDIFVSPFGVPGPQGLQGGTPTLAQSDYDAIMPWTLDLLPQPGATDAALKVGTWAVAVNSSAPMGAQLSNSSVAQNDEIGWDLPLAKGTWTLTLLYAKASTQGIFTVLVDNASVGTVDAYNAATTYTNQAAVSGIAIATNAKHRVSLRAASKNASSSGFQLTFMLVQLRRTA